MLSLAPGLISGSTTTPGHIECVPPSTIARMAGAGCESGAGLPGVMTLTAIFGSATAARIAPATESSDSPGIARHCTVARARCGRAFSACPPSIIVVVQVVRIWILGGDECPDEPREVSLPLTRPDLGLDTVAHHGQAHAVALVHRCRRQQCG